MLQAAQVLVLVAQQRAASVAQAVYRQQSAVLQETDRIVVLAAILQSIPVLQELQLAERRQVLLAELAAQVRQLAVRQRVALVELVETRMVAQELQVAHQEAAALLTVVQVLLVEIAVS